MDFETSAIEKYTEIGREATRFDLDQLSHSPDTENALSIIPYDVLTEASKYNLTDYYTEKLVPKKHFFKKIPIETIMKWSPTLITEPLTKIPDYLTEAAIKMFKRLVSYMGDRKSVKSAMENVKSHLEIAFKGTEDLKDEAFVQVLKQMKDHREYDKSIKAWKFLAILASTCPPSEKLYYSIMNFLISEIKNNIDKNIVMHANYVLVRLFRICESKRRQLPTENEIAHIENMKPIMFPIYFFSETFTQIPTESYTTVNEMKTKILSKVRLNIARSPYFALYEICNKQENIEERYLDENDKLVDILSLWTKESDNYIKQNKIIDFKIYLKLNLYYGYKEDDNDTVTIYYVQTRYDVYLGKYNFSEEIVITLAALQLYINNNSGSAETAYRMLEKDVENYIPLNVARNHNSKEWTVKIMDFYSTLKIKSKLEGKLSYLEQIKQTNLWESTQIHCKFSKTYNIENNNNLPDDLILAIKPQGISILNLQKEDVYYIPFSIVASWGSNNNLFVIYIDRGCADTEKIYFETYQTKIVQILIQSYCYLMAGKSINELINDNSNISRRLDNVPSSFSTGVNIRSKSASSFKK